ncbi:MAG: CpsD/CapB family tyrosine-protein kinase [Myxococcota bacterium]
MGKIHDALQRAEEERARQGAPPAGAAAEVAASAEPQSRRRAVAEQRKRVRDSRRSRIIMGDVESDVTEEYRTLRARIQSIRRENPLRSLVVTSTLPGEGKTTTAVNLALSFGLEREGRTCLIDADLRTPAIHHGFHEDPPSGLAELLESDEKLEDTLVAVPDTHLSVLMVKRLPEHPAELLGSARMRELLQELTSRFDTVILDAPPVLGLPDATTLVDLCDAALLVVAKGASGLDEVESALERIDTRKLIGTVFNRSDDPPRSYGAAYGRGST